jgi:hypothetical protein
MKDISVIARIPEVVGAVLSDPSGALLDAFGSVDGEAAGAVHAYSVLALSQAGEMLGLGSFQRAAVVGPKAACVLTLQPEGVLGVYVDPQKPLALVEKKLEDLLSE